MSENIIEIKHLSKAFGEHKVLKDIDFSVKKRRSCLYHRFIWIREINFIKMYKSFRETKWWTDYL